MNFLRGVSQVLGLFGALSTAGACVATAHSNADGAYTEARAGTCDPQHPEEALSRLLNAPIVPPSLFGGVDPTGDIWGGLSLADMERAYCQSSPISEDEGTATSGWGNPPDFPVTVEYDKSNHSIDMFQLYPGYKGTLDFTSRPSALGDPSKPNPFGQHSYSIGVDRPVLRDGQPWALAWKTAGTWDKQSTEMFDALMYTFAPALPSTQDSCNKQQACLARALSDGSGLFGVRALGIYFDVENVDAPEPASSTPRYIYGFAIKMMPFSVADTFFKLDAEGPRVSAQNLGDRHSQCAMKLGMTFGSFLSDCVEVLSDAKANDLLKKKVLGGATRTVETTGSAALTATWSLDVTGLHPDFASARFDEQEPAATAAATSLVFDLRSIGKALNDYAADGSTLTLAGTAAVYREYARLTQTFLHAQMAQMAPSLPQFSLGDPSCLLPAGADPTAWHPARGCTGMEQFITPADPSTSSDPGIQRVSAGTAGAADLGIASALRPGEMVMAAFCTDPGTFAHCQGLSTDVSTGIFDATRNQVTAVLGGGDESTLSDAIRDRKSYVRLWAKALVKYLRAATQQPTDLADPRYDSLTPLDSEITFESVQDDLVSVKYLSTFEYRVHFLSGVADQILFH